MEYDNFQTIRREKEEKKKYSIHDRICKRTEQWKEAVALSKLHMETHSCKQMCKECCI